MQDTVNREGHDEIEASKAPLMEHLIELRARLIKALVALALTFVACFFFAGDIYNILIKPFAWVAGPEHTKFIYTALLEAFYSYDANTTRYQRVDPNNPESPFEFQFGEFNQLGINATLQARF